MLSNFDYKSIQKSLIFSNKDFEQALTIVELRELSHCLKVQVCDIIQIKKQTKILLNKKI